MANSPKSSKKFIFPVNIYVCGYKKNPNWDYNFSFKLNLRIIFPLTFLLSALDFPLMERQQAVSALSSSPLYHNLQAHLVPR